MIDDIRPQGIPLGHTGGAQGAQPGKPVDRTSESAPSAPVTRQGDTVQFSPEARARLAEASAGGLAPERVAEIRQRILQGAYDTTDVIQAVAERILGSGDLRL